MAPGLTFRKPQRCAYLHVCYAARDLRCAGFRTDCTLYQKSNGDLFSEERFNNEYERLIDKAKAKHLGIPA